MGDVSTQVRPSARSAHETGKVPVRIAALFPPLAVQVDLYLDSASDREPRLYSRASSPPTPRDLNALQNAGITTLYTTATEAAVLLEQFSEMLHSGIEMPPQVHFEVAREAVKAQFARSWTMAAADAVVTQAAQFAEEILDVCDGQSDTSDFIRSLLKHDGDTFTHVSNVCLYTIILLRNLGLSNKTQIASLGQAALLHDLGKRSICKNILKKPGALTRAERDAIAQHPRLGFEELCDGADLDRDQLLMVYHHHEKLDGTGYPVGLQGEEIHWTGRLCAVVDVFDALTGRRPYRKPATAEEASVFLNRGIGSHFDEEFVRCWSNTVRNRP